MPISVGGELHYGAAEIARLFGRSRKTVTAWCLRGLLDGAQKIGRDWFVPKSAIVGFRPPKMGRPRNEPAAPAPHPSGQANS